MSRLRQPKLADDEWTCSRCTLLNKSRCSVCQVCGARRDFTVGAIGVDNLSISNDPSISDSDDFERGAVYSSSLDFYKTPKDSANKETGSDWSCSRCTYLNTEGYSTCKICSNPGPANTNPIAYTVDESLSKSRFEHKINESGIADNERRIVIIGKTGTGKSATANMIIGSQQFVSQVKAKSVTSECKLVTVHRFERKIVIVDTPGLFDTGMTNDKVINEIVKCIGMTSPGPHAILFVTSIGRFTKEEQATVRHFVNHFGEGIYSYLMVLFTRKDDLDNDGLTIDEYVKDVPEELKNVLRLCSNRYTAFNNRLTYNDGSKQAEDVLKKIDHIVSVNGGSYYSNEMYAEAEKAMLRRQEEIKKQLAEKKKREMDAMKQELSKQFEKEFEKSRAENKQLEDQIATIKLQSQNAEERADALKRQINDLKIERDKAMEKADKRAQEAISIQMEQMTKCFQQLQQKVEMERAEADKYKQQEEEIQKLKKQVEESDRRQREEVNTRNRQEVEEEKAKKEKEIEELKQNQTKYRIEQEQKERLRRKGEQKVKQLEKEKRDKKMKHKEEMERLKNEEERKKKLAEERHKRDIANVRDTTRKEVEEENVGFLGRVWRKVKNFFGFS